MNQKTVILSVDGGGIRGLIAATLLSLLEKDLPESLYDTFDMYAGSSVGSWLTLAVSGLHYNGEQILELFNEDNVKQIFSKRWLSFLTLFYGTKYHGQGKRDFLNKMFGDAQFLSLEKPTLITAYDIINNQAVVFKSHGKNSDTAYNPTIAEVADISSAAPTYFPPVKSTDKPARWLVDGGIIANDPTLCIITEALRSGHKLEDIKVLSIGSGISLGGHINGTAAKTWGKISWLEHGIINDLFSGNTTVTEYQAAQLLGDRYLRINDNLPATEDPMDNIQPASLKALMALGHTWYQKYYDELLAWLKI